MPSSRGHLRRPTTLRIRPAEEPDAEAIRTIYNEAVQTTTATFDTEPRALSEQRRWFKQHDFRHPVLVAERGHTVIGWASLSPWSERRAYDGTAEISVYVDEAWRGQGIGRRLLSKILSQAATRGFHTILARVAAGNPVSRTMHLGAGFTPVGVMHEVGYKFGQYVDVELMERPVKQKRETR